MSIWTAAVTLFLILDPIGNTPIIATLLKQVPHTRHRWIIIRENLIALGVLLFFLFTGQALLGVLGIREPELGIAGGVIVFLIALRMVFPSGGGIMGENQLEGEPLVVPLAIPLLAGPSAIAIVMLFSSGRPRSISMGEAVGAILIAWTASLATQLVGQRIARFLGRRGIIATERLMGMVLCAISIHMILDGLTQYISVVVGSR